MIKSLTGKNEPWLLRSALYFSKQILHQATYERDSFTIHMGITYTELPGKKKKEKIYIWQIYH